MLPETMRSYAQERLAASGEAEAWRSRHRDHFLALAKEAEPHLTGPEQAVWLGHLESEHDNLRAALQNSGDAELRLAAALWRFWMMRGFVSEGRERYTELLSQR